MTDQLRKQLLAGRQFQGELSNVALSPQAGGLSRLVASFRARRQANRNEDLINALAQQKHQQRSRIIGQLPAELRQTAEELPTEFLQSALAKKFESALTPEEVKPLSPEGKRQRDIKKGLITPQQLAQSQAIEQAGTFQKEQAKVLGKARGTDIDKLKTFETNFPELQKTVGRLEELSNIASFTPLDVGVNFARRITGEEPSEGAKARAEFDSTVKNVIFPLLSQTFKGTISDSERKALLSTLADKNLSPKEKQAQMKAFITQKSNEIISLRRKLGLQTQTSVQPTQQTTQGQILNFNPDTGGFE